MDFVSGSYIKIDISEHYFQNHYKLIGKYIFVMFLSLLVITIFREMSVRTGEQGPHDVEI